MTANGQIILRVSPNEFVEIANIEKFDDGSGYASLLSVSSGSFSCCAYPFYFDDLKGFTKAITKAYERVEGKGRLGQAYEKDFIEVQVFRGGRVLVAGFIEQNSRQRQELRFEFECDQTFLPGMLQSLAQVAKELGKAP
jgi:hypothetical protein